jgi:hypothetical protein
MPSRSYENLKPIRFEDELLPNWAQLLDVASMIAPVSQETRQWFSTLINSNGVDDSRTVLTHCQALRSALKANRESVLAELRRAPDDLQAGHIYAAWIYALDTMMQQAASTQTCSWIIDGLEQSDDDDSGGGEIALHRA